MHLKVQPEKVTVYWCLARQVDVSFRKQECHKGSRYSGPGDAQGNLELSNSSISKEDPGAAAQV